VNFSCHLKEPLVARCQYTGPCHRMTTISGFYRRNAQLGLGGGPTVEDARGRLPVGNPLLAVDGSRDPAGRKPSGLTLFRRDSGSSVAHTGPAAWCGLRFTGCPPPFYCASAPNTSFGLDATRALLRFGRPVNAALEFEMGALS
jgi:hypothetical protein